MRRFAAVALREVAERRFVLLAAAAAAALPFLVPLLPSVPGSDAGTARAVTALVLACTFGTAGAVLVGASVVGRELAEKRLSFHFARPVSAPEIWGGKLAGGLALVLLAEAVVYLPASLASGRFPGLLAADDAPAMAAALLVAVPLFLLAWVGSVAVRSRSPWLVADFLLLAGTAAALFLLGRRLLRFGHVLGPSVALAVAAVLLAALLAGTFAQVAAGRTDARRGHGAQSLALWCVLLVGLVAGGAWVSRTVDPGVARLEGAMAEPAGRGGDWTVVVGSTPGAGSGASTYLLDLAGGRSVLLRPGWMTTVSTDGSRAAHVAAVGSGDASVELEAIDLRTRGSAVLPLTGWPDGIDLTPDGRRLAVVVDGLCQVLELPSFRLLASARVSSERWAFTPGFLGPDVVRLLPKYLRSGENAARGAGAVPDPDSWELHVATRRMVKLARLEVSTLPVRPPDRNEPGREPRYAFLPGPDRSRVVLSGLGSAAGVRLLDAATGAVLAAVDAEDAGGPRGFFLSDGRVVLSEPGPDGLQLHLFSPDGARVSSIRMPAAAPGLRFGSEPGPGLLQVALARDEARTTWSWHLVDLAAGTATPIEGAQPQRSWWSGALSYPAPGAPVTRLAADADGRLVLHDPATGERRALTRAAPRRK